MLADAQHPTDAVAKTPTVPLIRLTSAWIITMLVLPYAWSRTLVIWMWVGEVVPRFVIMLVVGLLGAALLTFGLSSKFRPGFNRLVGVTVALTWCIVHGVLVWFYVGDHMPKPYLFLLLLSATAWVAWAGWMFYWPLHWGTRSGVLIVLVAGTVIFPRLVMVEGLTGDSHVNFLWRGTVPRPGRVALASGQETAAFLGNIILPAVGEDDYTQFLGPQRLAVQPKARLARDWNKTAPRLIWRQPIGGGWSSFAMVGDYAITQEQRGPEECVVCYRVSDGAKMWVHADQVLFDSSLGGPGPRATPTIADGKVYTVGATGILNCLEGNTGRRLWSVDILADNEGKNISHGVCGSPLLVDDCVIVNPTGENGISLAAYHRQTGYRVWQGGHDQASYGSALLAELAGQRQILLSTSAGAVGHDVRTGQVLWRFPWTNSEKVNCAQPIANAGGTDQVFISTGYGTGCALFRVEQAADGTWSTEKLWELPRAMRTKFTTPVLHKGCIYGLDEGILACVDLAKKKQVWKEGRYQHGQVLLAGDLLLIQAENGNVILVDPSPAGLHELGRFHAISGKTWNNPALAGKYLLVRNAEEAACFALPLAEN